MNKIENNKNNKMEDKEDIYKNYIKTWVFNLFSIIIFIIGIIIGIVFYANWPTMPQDYCNKEIYNTSFSLNPDSSSIILQYYDRNQQKFINHNKSRYDWVEIEKTTNSMGEIMPRGSRILIYFEFDDSDLQIGTIAVYEANMTEYKRLEYEIDGPRLVVHRIIDIKNINGTKYYRFKGDNLNIFDEVLVKKEEIIGVVGGLLFF